MRPPPLVHILRWQLQRACRCGVCQVSFTTPFLPLTPAPGPRLEELDTGLGGRRDGFCGMLKRHFFRHREDLHNLHREQQWLNCFCCRTRKRGRRREVLDVEVLGVQAYIGDRSLKQFVQYSANAFLRLARLCVVLLLFLAGVWVVHMMEHGMAVWYGRGTGLFAPVPVFRSIQCSNETTVPIDERVRCATRRDVQRQAAEKAAAAEAAVASPSSFQFLFPKVGIHK